ncbi:MAG: hypothetical protein RDU89_05665 [bacterium]|nr:hypothetical protein [bacterium]
MALALIALVLLMPFAFRGLYFIEPAHAGYVACHVGESTRVSILFNDYGRWPWVDASGAIRSIVTDNPDLEVTSFVVAPTRLDIPCQRMELRMEVTPRSPGEHYLTALTIVRGGQTRTLPIGSVLFDARLPGQDGKQLLETVSNFTVLETNRVDESDEISVQFHLCTRSIGPLDVSVLCSRLPEGVLLTAGPVEFGWPGAFRRLHLSREADGHPPGYGLVIDYFVRLHLSREADGEQPRRRVVLVRPWLVVSSDQGETLELGPLFVLDWP